jgi:catechol 2,3-dioxygenase-like lactoylglutathione lyase family enzyme
MEGRAVEPQTSLVAFVASTDLDRTEAFYGGVLGPILGLALSDERPYALSATLGGASLRITAVKQLAAAPYTVLGFEVADVGAAVAQLTASGVEFLRYPGMGQDPRGIWSAPGGAHVAWFHDPDGNVLSLTQLIG